MRARSIAADEDAPRLRKVRQRLHRLEKVMTVDDVGRFAEIGEPRDHRHACGGDLPGQWSEDRREHSHVMTSRHEAARQVAGGEFRARPAGERGVGNKDAKAHSPKPSTSVL